MNPQRFETGSNGSPRPALLDHSSVFPALLSWSYAKALLTPAQRDDRDGRGRHHCRSGGGIVTGIWVGAGLPGRRLLYAVLAAFRSIPDLTLAILCV